MIAYDLIRIIILFTFLEVFFLFSGYAKSTDLKKDDNLRILNCYERRQNVTDCICRKGHWTSTNNPNQYKYPDALKKNNLYERWGECDIPPPPWVWKVDTSCTEKTLVVRAYSSEAMCEIINGRNILIVGDSINNEFFHTFLGLAWPPGVSFVKKNTELVNEATLSSHFGAGNALIVNITCPKVSQNYAVSFIRNYCLTTNKDIPMVYRVDIKKEPRAWVNAIAQRNIDIVFMNRGAHYIISDLLLPQLIDTFTYLRKNFPKVQTYFRNTPIGHVGCNKFRTAKPLETRPTKFDWDWGSFEAQNNLIYKLIKENFREVIYLDVSRSTDLRADSHMGGEDCLHYCIPGPIDNWVQMFLTSIEQGDLLDCSHIKGTNSTH